MLNLTQTSLTFGFVFRKNQTYGMQFYGFTSQSTSIMKERMELTTVPMLSTSFLALSLLINSLGLGYEIAVLTNDVHFKIGIEYVLRL